MSKNQREKRFEINSDSESQGQSHNQSSSIKSQRSQSNIVEEDQGSYYINDENVYQVQAILDKRLVNRKPQYLIKWKDWDLPEHNTWQNLNNLKGVKQIINEFERQLKLKKVQNSRHIKKSQKKAYIEKKFHERNQQKKKLRLKLKNTSINDNQRSSEMIQQSAEKNQKQLKRRQTEQNRKKELEKQKQRQRVKMMEKKKKKISSSSQSEEAPIQTQITSNMSSACRQGSTPLPLISESKRISSQSSQKSNKQQKNEKMGQNKQTTKNKKQSTSEIEIKEKSSKPKQSISRINAYMIQNKTISYEVNICNQKGRTIGVRLMSSDELKKQQPQKLSYFLEQRLIDVDLYEEMIAQTVQKNAMNLKNQQ